MTYQEALEYINETKKVGSVLGLENITQLLIRLGNPQDKVKFIHIAGTNGKGSTAAYIGTILAVAGYKVGRYISPVVFEYRECIQISQVKIKNNQTNNDQTNNDQTNNDQTNNDETKNNQTNNDQTEVITNYISEKDVAKYITMIAKASKEMIRDGFNQPTPFEIETAMAFLCFLDEKCDIVVLETGLGGRLDATNVIKTTVCAVITSISMDHMEFLGDTLSKIATEKAGIIKHKVPVTSYEQVQEVMNVINKTCKEQESKVSYADFTQIRNLSHDLNGITFDYKNYKSIKIKLLGENQVKNAIVAIETINLLLELGYKIKEDILKRGLLLTKWSGRFEIIKEQPLIVVDGAHNEEAAISLSKSIQIYFKEKRLIFIMGIFADKDYEKVISHTVALADVIITITPDNVRALQSKDLAQVVKKYHSNVINANDIENALTIAEEMAGINDVIISFGSLSYLGEIYRYYKK